MRIISEIFDHDTDILWSDIVSQNPIVWCWMFKSIACKNQHFKDDS